MKKQRHRGRPKKRKKGRVQPATASPHPSLPMMVDTSPTRDRLLALATAESTTPLAALMAAQPEPDRTIGRFQTLRHPTRPVAIVATPEPTPAPDMSTRATILMPLRPDLPMTVGELIRMKEAMEAGKI